MIEEFTMTIDTENKKIYDACCGGRMFYFDKEDERVLFNDRHPRKAVLCDGRIFECVPDTVDDFKNLPYKDNHFDLVIFDPPHIQQAGKSYMAIKYGTATIEDVIAGFKECWRVTGGTLIFKWNDTGEKVNDLINAFGVRPLAGQRRAGSGKTNTIWLIFYKGAESINRGIKDDRTNHPHKKEGENFEHGSVTYSDGIVIIDAFFEASPEALKEITKDVADLIKKYEK